MSGQFMPVHNLIDLTYDFVWAYVTGIKFSAARCPCNVLGCYLDSIPWLVLRAISSVMAVLYVGVHIPTLAHFTGTNGIQWQVSQWDWCSMGTGATGIQAYTKRE